jgi:hypothetical protein
MPLTYPGADDKPGFDSSSCALCGQRLAWQSGVVEKESRALHPLEDLFHWWRRQIGVPPEVWGKQWQALMAEFTERNEPVLDADVKQRLWEIEVNNFLEWLRT